MSVHGLGSALGIGTSLCRFWNVVEHACSRAYQQTWWARRLVVVSVSAKLEKIADSSIGCLTVLARSFGLGGSVCIHGVSCALFWLAQSCACFRTISGGRGLVAFADVRLVLWCDTLDPASPGGTLRPRERERERRTIHHGDRTRLYDRRMRVLDSVWSYPCCGHTVSSTIRRTTTQQASRGPRGCPRVLHMNPTHNSPYSGVLAIYTRGTGSAQPQRRVFSPFSASLNTLGGTQRQHKDIYSNLPRLVDVACRPSHEVEVVPSFTLNQYSISY